MPISFTTRSRAPSTSNSFLSSESISARFSFKNVSDPLVCPHARSPANIVKTPRLKRKIVFFMPGKIRCIRAKKTAWLSQAVKLFCQGLYAIQLCLRIGCLGSQDTRIIGFLRIGFWLLLVFWFFQDHRIGLVFTCGHYVFLRNS